ncbi:MAG: hypothetical protein JWQ98_286 [Chlorobi bacterium]|nr:hypothetical protein [Chlorobiota bacterium]
MKSLFLAVLLASLAFCACSTPHTNGSAGDSIVARETTAVKSPVHQREPNSVLIVGTITAINPMPKSDLPNTPCSRAPCEATVHIDSIIRGGVIRGPLPVMGESVAMTFTYTLGQTAALYPKLKENYPGLSVGSHFEAEIFATPRNLPDNGGLVKGSPTDTKTLPTFPATRFFVNGYSVR